MRRATPVLAATTFVAASLSIWLYLENRSLRAELAAQSTLAPTPTEKAFAVAEAFTGLKGKYVKVADTVRSFKEVVEGKHDHIPEQAFYMQGSIDDVLERYEEMKKQG